MPQSVSKVVDVNITISPKSASMQGFGTLCIFGDSDVIQPHERYREYTNLNEVVADFGLDSEEYKAADLYFSQDPAPDSLKIARWLRNGAPATLIGGFLTADEQDITKWQRITNGSLSFDLDGVNVDVLDLDFSKQTNLNGVAAVINEALINNGIEANIKWNGQQFVLATNDVGAYKTLSYMFVSDRQENIHQLLGLDSTRATAINGTDYIPEIPEQPATSGYLKGTDISGVVDTLKTIKDGSFKVTINDIEIPINDLDFTSAASLGPEKALVEIARVVDAAIAPTANVHVEDNGLVIVSNSVGESSTVENPVGGEIYPVSSGYLVGTDVSSNLSILQGVANGTFDIDIDGETVHVYADLSDCRSFDEIALEVQNQLQGKASVRYDGTKFIVTSYTTGSQSTVKRAKAGEIYGVSAGYLTGTNISGSLANIQEVTNGSLKINIDGATVDLRNMDFSEAQSLEGVANVLTNTLGGRGSAKVQDNKLVITSPTLGTASIVDNAAEGAQYEIGGTHGYLTGSTVVSGGLSILQMVENGSFKTTIDGTERSIKNVDLSQAQSFDDIADILEAKLAPYATVDYSGSSFVITSTSTGAASTVSRATAGETYEAEAATAAYLTGTNIDTLEELRNIEDGSFNITIDRELIQVTDLNLSNVTSMQDVVDELYNYLGDKAVINYEDDHLVITSKTTGVLSQVTQAVDGVKKELGQTSGYLTGSNLGSGMLDALKEVDNGAMKISVDGTPIIISDQDFTGIESWEDAAAILEASLEDKATVEYNGTALVVTSKTTGENSTVDNAISGDQVVIGGTQGTLTGGALTSTDLLSLKQIDKGTINFNINGTPLKLSKINCSNLNSIEEIPALLDDQLSSFATIEAVQSGDSTQLKITSLISGSSSIVDYATEGTPIYEGTSAKLTSGVITESGTASYLSSLQAVKNGNFKIDINGETVDVTALNFSACETLQDVAETLQEKLTDYATVAIETAATDSYLTITSLSEGAQSTIAKAVAGSGSDVSIPAELFSSSNLDLEAFKQVTNGALYVTIDHSEQFSNTTASNNSYWYVMSGRFCLTNLNFSKCNSLQDIADILNYKLAGYGHVALSGDNGLAFKSTNLFSEEIDDDDYNSGASIEFQTLTNSIISDYFRLGSRISDFWVGSKIQAEVVLERLKKVSNGLSSLLIPSVKDDNLNYNSSSNGPANITDPYLERKWDTFNLNAVTSMEEVATELTKLLQKGHETYDQKGQLIWSVDHFIFKSDLDYTASTSIIKRDHKIYFAPEFLGWLGGTSLADYISSFSGYSGLNNPDTASASHWVKKSGDIVITINDQEQARISLQAFNDSQLSAGSADPQGILDVVAQINLGLKTAGLSDRVYAIKDNQGFYLVSKKTGTSSRLIIELPSDDDTFTDLVGWLNEGTPITATEDNEAICLDIWELLGFEEPSFDYSETDILDLFQFESLKATEETVTAVNNTHTTLKIGTAATVLQGTDAYKPAALVSAALSAEDITPYITALREVQNGNFTISIDGETISVTGLDFRTCTNLTDVAAVITPKLNSKGIAGVRVDGDNSYLTIESVSSGDEGTVTYATVGTGTELEGVQPNNDLHTLLKLDSESATIEEGSGEPIPTVDNQLYKLLKLDSSGASEKVDGIDIYNASNLHELLGLNTGTPIAGQVLYNNYQAHIPLGLDDGVPTAGIDAAMNDNQLHSKLGLATGTPTAGTPIYNTTDLHVRLGLIGGTPTRGGNNDNQLHIKLGLAGGEEFQGLDNKNDLHILLGLVNGESVAGHEIIPAIPAKEATPGRLIGAPINLDEFVDVIDGNFKFTVDTAVESLGVESRAIANEVNHLDLTGINSLSALVEMLNQQIKGATFSIGEDGQSLVLTSHTTGALSNVGFLEGVDLLKFDIGGLLAMTQPKATSLTNGFDPESPVDTVAVMAYGKADWYAATFASVTMPTDDELLEVAKYIEAQNDVAHILGVTITDRRILERAYTNDLASRCKELGLNRTVAMYSSNSPYAICAFLGRAFVVNFNGVNTTITMMFKQAKLVVAEDLTNTQADILKDKRCNVFITYQNGTAIIQHGVMTGDYYFDERHGADWLRNYIQTALFNLLYTTQTKIPQTDSGTNIIVTEISRCLDQAVSNGFVGTGTWNGDSFGSLKRGDLLANGYYVYAPALATQSQVDRDERKSVPIQIAAKLQGAIHSIEVDITLNR